MNYRKPLLDASLTDLDELSLSSYHMHATTSHVGDGDGAPQAYLAFCRSEGFMSPAELEQVFDRLHDGCESPAPLPPPLTQPARRSAGGEDLEF